MTVDLEQLRRDLRRDAWRFGAWFVPLLLAAFSIGLAISPDYARWSAGLTQPIDAA